VTPATPDRLTSAQARLLDKVAQATHPPAEPEKKLPADGKGGLLDIRA